MMIKKSFLITFILLFVSNISIDSFTSVKAQDDEMEKIKRRIEETKARHYQRRGGVHGNTIYIMQTKKLKHRQRVVFQFSKRK